MDDNTILKQLKTIFIQEAKERINSIINCLLKIHQDITESEKNDLIEVIFRDMHSLKGASRSISLKSFESIFQSFEELMSDVRKKKIAFDSDIAEFLRNSVEKLDELINEENINSIEDNHLIDEIKFSFENSLNKLKYSEKMTVQKTASANPVQKEIQESPKTENKGQNPLNEKLTQENIQLTPGINVLSVNSENTQAKTTQSISETKKNIETLNITDKPNAAKNDKVENTVQKPNTSNSGNISSQTSADTVRIASSKLDSLLLRSENLIKIKQMFQENVSIINNLLNDIHSLKLNTSKIQSDIIFLKQEFKKFQESDRRSNKKPLTHLISFLDSFEIQIKNIDLSVKNLIHSEKENFRNSEKMIDSFLSEIKEVAMLPFSNILITFPRMVNDISKNLKKDINFQMSGEFNEIDRRILQELKDPLIHIIRNCIDHGIEEPEIRKKNNKPERGNINLSISINESGKIEILIEDDGKGIDENAVKNKLIRDNIITDKNAEKLTKNMLIDYLFLSGFSTKDIITDISGRGLGLAIVKERLEKLGGKIEIDSQFRTGTKIKLTLPVALSTFKGVIIKSANRHFIIPSINVERIIRLKNPKIKKIENRDSIAYRGITYPIVELNRILNLENYSSGEENEAEDTITCVIIEKNNRFMALTIDFVFEEKEILVKELGSQLKKVKNISGATILNSGEIVPILNIEDLFLSAENINYSSNKQDSKSGVNSIETVKTYKLLVVEDSITSRMLIRNILESSGYNVETAVDGIAALTVLKTQNFDLIVSDIEMPRMDGFTLTQRVRADEKLSRIPIILLTSLASDEDKERGIESGANAYIIKSQFDQNNLLETIDSLL